MKLSRHIGLLLAVVLCLSSCGMSQVKDITVTSVDVLYVVPTSTRSIDAKVRIGIDNPARSFAVDEMKGTIRYFDKPIAHFSTGPVQLEGRCGQVYDVPCTVTLAEGASYLDVMKMAAHRSLDGVYADIDLLAALRKNGVLRRLVTIRDVEISQLKSQ